MKKLIVAAALAVTAMTVQASEEKTDIKMPFQECVTQARDLAKNGSSVKEVDLVRSTGLMMIFFETKTHHVSVSCMLIGRGYDQMSVTKQSLEDYRAKNAKLQTERQAKTQNLSKQLGL